MDLFFYSFGFSVLLVPALALIRFFYLANQCEKPPSVRTRSRPCKTMIVVGAGGHGMEMMKLLTGLNLEHYSPRTYIIAQNDKISRRKVEEFELPVEPSIWEIMRAREVGQSYVTSVLTTLGAFVHSFPILLQSRPDLVLCNGPGTCIPVCLSAYLLKFFGVKSIKIVYIESICRAEFLSLSAMILYNLRIADEILVQWPQLTNKYSRTKYIGRLI